MAVLESEVSGEVLRLTLDRPEKRNALNVDLLSALVDTLEAASGAYPVVVVEGAGEAFTAGADLDEASVGTERIGLFQDVTRAARDFDGVVVGKLHGYAVGGGFELTLAFDLRYAAQGTTFRLSETEIGVTVSNATTSLLPLLVGGGRARELVFTRREVAASEAASLGLVTDVVPEDALEERVSDVAADVVENTDPAAVRANKELLNAAYPVDAALAREELRNVKLREETATFDDASPE